MTTAPIALRCFKMFSLFLLATSAFGKDSHKSFRDALSDPVPRPQLNVLRSQSKECTHFKYSNNGMLYGCGYSLDVFRLTTLQTPHASLSSYIAPTHSISLDQHALHSVTYDIWSAANLSFAFEKGTKRLFTAWGRNLQLRHIYSSNGFELFENIHPDRPPYNHECAPFCAILHGGHIDRQDGNDYLWARDQFKGNIETRQSFQNNSVLRMPDYSSPFVGSQFSTARAFGITGCESCNFGTSPRSCRDIMRTCLSNEFSCNTVSKPETDNDSIFCQGIYHVFLNPVTAFCPIDATKFDMYMYGICDCIYYQLQDKIDSGDYQLKVYKVSPNSLMRQLQTTERASDSRIGVHLSAKKCNLRTMKREMNSAIRKGTIQRIDARHIDGPRTKRTIKCQPIDYQGFKCRCEVDIYLKGLVE